VRLAVSNLWEAFERAWFEPMSLAPVCGYVISP